MLLSLSPIYVSQWTIFFLQLITDVNIAVAVEAIQAIGNLAKGLRTHFSGSSRFLLPGLLVSLFAYVLSLGNEEACASKLKSECFNFTNQSYYTELYKSK